MFTAVVTDGCVTPLSLWQNIWGKELVRREDLFWLTARLSPWPTCSRLWQGLTSRLGAFAIVKLLTSWLSESQKIEHLTEIPISPWKVQPDDPASSSCVHPLKVLPFISLLWPSFNPWAFERHLCSNHNKDSSHRLFNDLNKFIQYFTPLFFLCQSALII